MSSRLSVIVALLLAAACGTFERGDPSPPSGDSDQQGDGDSAGGPSFATTVFPIIEARCASCHGSGGLAASSALSLTGDAAADYDTTLSLVSLGSPATSALLQKATGASHGGGAVISSDSDDYRTILAWITGGASP